MMKLCVALSFAAGKPIKLCAAGARGRGTDLEIDPHETVRRVNDFSAIFVRVVNVISAPRLPSSVTARSVVAGHADVRVHTGLGVALHLRDPAPR